MPELLKENNDPLNQVCREKLEEAGDDYDVSSLYWIQLALWGLESGKAEVEKQYREVLELLLAKLMQAKPEKAMKWLLGADPEEDGVPFSSPATLKENPPEEVAEELLEAVHLLLLEKSEGGYP